MRSLLCCENKMAISVPLTVFRGEGYTIPRTDTEMKDRDPRGSILMLFLFCLPFFDTLRVKLTLRFLL